MKPKSAVRSLPRLRSQDPVSTLDLVPTLAHLLRLPVGYFETRPAGQTVARMRELETIRTFLTGQALSSALDLVFTIVFITVMFVYSRTLTFIVLGSIPIYILIAAMIRPLLRERINERFNRGALSQQFLVESVVIGLVGERGQLVEVSRHRSRRP